MRSAIAAPNSTSSTLTNSVEPVVALYFKTINTESFQAASQLFAIDGMLQPPFEEKIAGREAIAAYLEKEAKGFTLQPEHGSWQLLNDGNTDYQILGRVQTPWFSVNVGWQFLLTPNSEIAFVKVKLLASLQELAKLRR
jgi:hypothetical protein